MLKMQQKCLQDQGKTLFANKKEILISLVTNHTKSSTVKQMDLGFSTDPAPLLTSDAILRNNLILAF